VPVRVHLLGLLAAALIISIMVAQPILPLYLESRGLPTVEVGLLVGLMSLSLIVTELGALAVSQRLGRRGTIMLGSLGAAATQLWFALAVTRPEWYLSRLLFGAFRGLLWPLLFAEVADTAPAGRHGPTFALFWLYFGTGLLIGPWLGGWLGDAFGLRMPLQVSAFVCLIPLGFAPGISPRRDAPVSLGGSLRTLLAHPEIVAIWSLNGIHTTIYALFSTFLPLYAAGVGLAATQIGLLFAMGSATFTLAQLVAGRVLERGAILATLIPVYLARSAIIAAIPLLHTFGGLLGANALLGIVGAIIPPALSARLAAATPSAYTVVAMGAQTAAADLGFFVGPVLGGIAAGSGLLWPFVLTVPIALVGAGVIRTTLRPNAAA